MHHVFVFFCKLAKYDTLLKFVKVSAIMYKAQYVNHSVCLSSVYFSITLSMQPN